MGELWIGAFPCTVEERSATAPEGSSCWCCLSFGLPGAFNSTQGCHPSHHVPSLPPAPQAESPCFELDYRPPEVPSNLNYPTTLNSALLLSSLIAKSRRFIYTHTIPPLHPRTPATQSAGLHHPIAQQESSSSILCVCPEHPPLQPKPGRGAQQKLWAEPRVPPQPLHRDRKHAAPNGSPLAKPGG